MTRRQVRPWLDDDPGDPVPDLRGQSHRVALHELRSAFDEAPTGMALLRTDGVVLAANRALVQLLGRAEEQLVGDTLFSVTHPDDVAAARASCEQMQAGATRVLRHESRFLSSTGTVVSVLVSTSRPAEVPGCPPHLIMHVEDITDRKSLEDELRRQASHDPLTGLPNRALLMDRLEHALVHGARSATATCLLFLDLNGFKQVNDDLGHAAGDQVLVQLARRLTEVLRAVDTAARLGGDEFAVLCEGTGPGEAAVVADRVRTAAGTPFVLPTTTVTLSAAIGVAVHVHDDRTVASAADLLARADRSMYADKRGTSP